MAHEVVRVVLAAQGLVVKHVDAAEVRVIVATVLGAAAKAVLVANHLSKRGAHLVTARPVEEVAWRQKARGIKTCGEKKGGDAAAGDKQSINVQQERFKKKYTG